MKGLFVRSTLVLLGLSMTSCYSNPNKFNKHLSERVCDWYYECYRANAELVYSSYDDCVDTTRDNLEDDEANCEYDKDEARDCMDWVKENSDDCSMGWIEAGLEFAQQCGEVYTDCDGQQGLDLAETGGYEQLASYPPDTP